MLLVTANIFITDNFFKKNLGELYYSKANKSLVTITPTLSGAKLENCSSLD
jgi:hypothetical protein